MSTQHPQNRHNPRAGDIPTDGTHSALEADDTAGPQLHPTRAAAVDTEITQRLLNAGCPTAAAAEDAFDIEAIAAQAITPYYSPSAPDSPNAGERDTLYACTLTDAQLWQVIASHSRSPRMLLPDEAARIISAQRDAPTSHTTAWRVQDILDDGIDLSGDGAVAHSLLWKIQPPEQALATMAKHIDLSASSGQQLDPFAITDGNRER